MAEKKKYQIRVQNELVPVTEKVYLTYYRMKRRELHLQEKDAKHGVFFIVPWIQRKPMEKMQSLI